MVPLIIFISRIRHIIHVLWEEESAWTIPEWGHAPRSSLQSPPPSQKYRFQLQHKSNGCVDRWKYCKRQYSLKFIVLLLENYSFLVLSFYLNSDDCSRRQKKRWPQWKRRLSCRRRHCSLRCLQDKKQPFYGRDRYCQKNFRYSFPWRLPCISLENESQSILNKDGFNYQMGKPLIP